MKLKYILPIYISATIFSGELIHTQQVSQEDTERVFANIYARGLWGNNQEGYGFSGYGSTIDSAAPYVKFLENFLKEQNIHSVVDVGCGDWAFSRHIQWNNAYYIGIDVVKNVIERNLAQFTKPNVKFIHADAIYTNLPSADLLICKDVLQHLPNENIQQFLSQLYKFKHCLITNDVDGNTFSSKNTQTAAGGYRSIDLTQPPFTVKGEKVLTYYSWGTPKQVFHIKH